MDSVAFTGASHTAKALLLELGRQLNGRNNGHLQLTESWLIKRGWSRNTPARARAELIERGLIVQTRQGGRNIGASLYAVTWLSINNYVGLDIGPRNYHPGAWALMENLNLAEAVERPTPKPGKPGISAAITGRNT
ncbi:hypothetical protein EZJ19_05735 [Parasulfuritortus cantonensis]|uniref:Helix-turn-helix domain-containing protein n=1 Tax=Parasulfuritortus cantonensis TaxID=2528202 RepID=A0A4V6NB10_9PROT|nr:hypothetical protein [Parasulfuritortus cantonensis]TCJ16092.1 hypothetical protein EZJ19_05735 [Parasulfuritortus cantonensis]